MFKHVLTYKDYHDVERTEALYFALTEADLMQMELADNGLDNLLKDIVECEDTRRLIGMFQTLLEKSYGEKSMDGQTFTRTPEILAKFKSKMAYSAMYMKLVTDTDFAVKFVEGIMPAELLAKAKQELAKKAIEKKASDLVIDGTDLVETAN
jgi:hypothetical protein